jgi:predicted amidohydrolase YtcJ
MIDLILHNARIVTQWPDQPLAQAIAVQKGRIIAVGSDDEILALASPGTRLIDARGRLALPAFTDAHIHLFDLARRRGVEADLAPVALAVELGGRHRLVAPGRYGVRVFRRTTDPWPRGLVEADPCDVIFQLGSPPVSR